MWFGVRCGTPLPPVITLPLSQSLGASDIGPQDNKFLLLQVGNGYPVVWFNY